MEMEVNGIVRKVIDVQIVYRQVGTSDNYWYFIQVKYNREYYSYDWEIIEGFENSKDAIKRAEDIKTAIDAEKKSLAEPEVCHG